MSNSKLVITSAPSQNKMNGQKVFTFFVSNGYMHLTFTNYGCTIISIFAPDKNGDKKNVEVDLKAQKHILIHIHILAAL